MDPYTVFHARRVTFWPRPPPFSLACDPAIFNFPSGQNLLACDPEKIDPPKSICITLRTTVGIIFKYAFQPKTWLVHEIFTCNDSYRTHFHLLHRYTCMYMVCLYILFVNTSLSCPISTMSLLGPVLNLAARREGPSHSFQRDRQ